MGIAVVEFMNVSEQVCDGNTPQCLSVFLLFSSGSETNHKKIDAPSVGNIVRLNSWYEMIRRE